MNEPVNHRFETIAAAGLVTLSQDGPARDWMLVLPAGSWKARDGRGPFVVGDLAAMQAIIDHTRSYAGATELMVDFDHQAKPLILGETGGRAEAAGWVKALEARPDGIWAEIEWTEAARTKIKALAYRYLSPLFMADKEGKIGLLLNIALVNVPAIDLQAVAANLHLKQESVHMDKIAEALGLKTGASEDAILAAVTALATTMGVIATALALAEDAKPEDIGEGVKALIAGNGKIVSALGLKAGARTDDVVALATTLKSATNDAPDPSKFVPIETVKALQTELGDLRKEVTGDKAIAAVDDAIKSGKLIPAQRDWALSLYARDKASFEDFIGKAVSLTASQMAEHGGAKPPKAKITALSASQKKTAAILGLSHETYLAQLQADQETAE